MASPQKENGHTDIANEIMEKLSLTELSGSEFRICLFILRKTWGWHQKEDAISISQIQKGTGLSRKTTIESTNKLVTKRLLLKTKNYINTLQFNKNHEEWVVTKRTLGSYQSVTRVVTKRLPKLVTERLPTKETKETNTKEIIPNGIREFGNSQINECRDYFLKVFQLPKEDGSIKWNRIYWSNLIKASRTGVEGVKWLIDQAHEDTFLRPNITSAKALSNKQVLIISRKREGVSYGGRKNIDARGIE